MTIYTQQELDLLGAEEYAAFLVDGLLVDPDEPITLFEEWDLDAIGLTE